MDIIQEFEKRQIKRKVPLIKPGDVVKVHQKIQEGDKERIQIFEGVVIKIHRGYGINGNITIRKIASGVGVEKTFPFHLPSIVKMEVVKRGKVRRAKLYFLRRLQEKAAKLKDQKLSEEVKTSLKFDTEEDKRKAEAEKAQKEKAKKEEKKDSTEKHEEPKQPQQTEDKSNKQPVEEKKETTSNTKPEKSEDKK